MANMYHADGHTKMVEIAERWTMLPRQPKVEVSLAETSRWPLPTNGRRVVIPNALVTTLSTHPLCCDCLPHGVGYYPQAAGHHMRRQAPRDHLVIYCVAGSGMAEQDGRLIPVRAGDVLLFRRDIAHRYRANPRDPWSIYWAHLGGSMADAYFEAVLEDTDTFVLGVGKHSRIIEEWELLLTTATRFRTPHLVHAANRLKSLLSLVALLRHQYQERHAPLDVVQVDAWLQVRLDQRIELAQLVEATSTLSRFQFIREYKRLTGQTPMQAFLHLKISRACYLLDVTDLNIAQVAVKLGYEDPYYFSRQFKKVMGIAPRDYRLERSPH